jgi:NADP-dependent 3-hydroxy acid dehydrogenase YdfG
MSKLNDKVAVVTGGSAGADSRISSAILARTRLSYFQAREAR